MGTLFSTEAPLDFDPTADSVNDDWLGNNADVVDSVNDDWLGNDAAVVDSTHDDRLGSDAAVVDSTHDDWLTTLLGSDAVVDLHGQQLTDELLGERIGPRLAGNGRLESLCLADNLLGDGTCAGVAAALAVSTTLCDLDVSNNRAISSAGAQRLARALCDGNTTLETLALDGCRLDDAAGAALAAALTSNGRLSLLSLGGNRLGDAAGVQLGAALRGNGTLRELNLWDNQLGDAAGDAIADGVRCNTALRRLLVGANRLGDAAGRALADAVAANTTLRRLHVEGNGLGDGAGVRFAAALGRPTLALTVLVLSRNRLSDAAGVPLARALKGNGTLKTLCLRGNKLTDASGMAFADALHSNTALRDLNLGGNALTDMSGRLLAMALLDNATLAALRLRGNQLTLVSDWAFAEALRSNTALRKLALSTPDASVATLRQLAARHLAASDNTDDRGTDAASINDRSQVADETDSSDESEASSSQETKTGVEQYWQVHGSSQGQLVIDEQLGKLPGGTSFLVHCRHDEQRRRQFALSMFFCGGSSRGKTEKIFDVLSQLPRHSNVLALLSAFCEQVDDATLALLPKYVQDLARSSLRQSRPLAQFFVTDHLPCRLGRYLAEQVRDHGCVHLDVALAIVTDVAAGLQHLARSGYVHLDMQPASVHLAMRRDAALGSPAARPLRAVIGEFGCARRVDTTDDGDCVTMTESVTRSTGGMWDSPSVVAPELLQAFRALHQRQDAEALTFDYSKQPSFELGVLAYQLLTGGHPLPNYPSMYEQPDGSVVYAVPPPELFAHLPDALQTLLPSLIACDPRHRPSLAHAIRTLHAVPRRARRNRASSWSSSAGRLRVAPVTPRSLSPKMR